MEEPTDERDLAELAYSLSLRTLVQQEAPLNEFESEDEVGIAETYRRLTYWLEGYHEGNRPKVARLFGLYRISVLALLGRDRLLESAAGASLRNLMSKSKPAPVPAPPPNLGIPETRTGGNGSSHKRS